MNAQNAFFRLGTPPPSVYQLTPTACSGPYMNTEVEGWSHSCELQIIGKRGGYPYCEHYT